MSEAQSNPPGPDLTSGIPVNDIPDGRMLLGHVGEDPVLLARRGEEFFAIGATCSHYGGPLAEGLMVEDTVRCPWHHACFITNFTCAFSVTRALRIASYGTNGSSCAVIISVGTFTCPITFFAPAAS